MKVKIFAAILLVLVLSAVTANTILLPKRIDRIIESVSAVSPKEPDAAKSIQNAHRSFLDAEGFFSLTLNHNDLCEVGSLFVETLAYLSVGDFKEAGVTKSRLIDALLHLRRLSEINIGSIF